MKLQNGVQEFIGVLNESFPQFVSERLQKILIEKQVARIYH